jgi:hypothetical protein
LIVDAQPSGQDAQQSGQAGHRGPAGELLEPGELPPQRDVASITKELSEISKAQNQMKLVFSLTKILITDIETLIKIQ